MNCAARLAIRRDDREGHDDTTTEGNGPTKAGRREGRAKKH